MLPDAEAVADWLARVMPTLSVLLVTVFSVVPWRVPEFVAFGLPFLTLGAIFYWAERDRRRIASPVVLGCGLMTDLVTDGPVGYWALLFLVGLALGGLAGRLAEGESSVTASWLGFAVSLPLVVAFGWAVASLYYLTLLDVRLVLFATAAGIAGYLPLAWLLGLLGDGGEAVQHNASRGGPDVFH